MVYAFLVHSLIPGQSTLIYQQVFNQGVTTSENNDDEIKTHRKNRLTDCAAQVHSEYQFRRAVLGRTVEDDIQRLHNDDTLPEFEVGFTQLQEDVPGKTAVWLGAGYTCFTLICDCSENRMLAESVLKTLIRFIQQHVGLLTSPVEAFSKPERISVILDKFLPQGNLIFMNHRVVRQLEKEVESLIKQ